LLSAFALNVQNCRCKRQNVTSTHTLPPLPHMTAALRKPQKSLVQEAQDYTLAASEKTLEIAKQVQCL
jgi:hypothetical protein